METTTTVLTVLTAAIFGAGGLAALAAVPPLRATWEPLNISQRLGRTTGVLEIAAALGLAISLWTAPTLGLAAALGLALLMIGAVTYHARSNDAPGAIAPATLGILSVATAILIATNSL